MLSQSDQGKIRCKIPRWQTITHNTSSEEDCCRRGTWKQQHPLINTSWHARTLSEERSFYHLLVPKPVPGCSFTHLLIFIFMQHSYSWGLHHNLDPTLHPLPALHKGQDGIQPARLACDESCREDPNPAFHQHTYNHLSLCHSLRWELQPLAKGMLSRSLGNLIYLKMPLLTVEWGWTR